MQIRVPYRAVLDFDPASFGDVQGATIDVGATAEHDPGQTDVGTTRDPQRSQQRRSRHTHYGGLNTMDLGVVSSVARQDAREKSDVRTIRQGGLDSAVRVLNCAIG